jgi:hypothetical protein
MRTEVCTDCVPLRTRAAPIQALSVLRYLNRCCARTQRYTVSAGVYGL